MSKRICITIQARMTSSRLPGKVLKPAVGKPMLELMIERLKRVPSAHDIIVCTTINASDDPVVELATRLGVLCWRGSEEDVLTRVLDGARHHGTDIIVETTGDCPLIDPDIIEQVIQTYLSGDWDYVSNVYERMFPIGMDTQVFSTDVLADVQRRTDDPFDHEHVSVYIYRHPEIYRCHNVPAPLDQTDPLLGLTLDTIEDYRLLKAIFEELYPQNPHFTLADILELLRRRPSLRGLNAHVPRTGVQILDVLLVGCGAVAGGYADRSDGAFTHAAAYRRYGAFHLAACVDPDAARRQSFAERWGIENAFASLEDALADGRRYDVVSICSPTQVHAEHLRRIADSGAKAVLAEKPLTGNPDESMAIVAQYRAAGIPLAVNYLRRWDPTVIALRDDLATGKWGQVLSAVIRYSKGIIHNGSHMLDLALLLLGPLSPVAAVAARIDHQADDPTLDAVLLTADGASVHLVGGDARAYFHIDLEIITTEGIISYGDGGFAVSVRRVAESTRFSGYRVLGDCEALTAGLGEAMVRAVADVHFSARGGPAPQCSGDDAVAVERLCRRLIDMARG
ncbi:MAG: Gfo/Idh/MocA family oxidoreductase [Magnetospirillum sp.]|nr:Gfo/Idh/MocA family oxidoreductase [Magnetospirillum sp.]